MAIRTALGGMAESPLRDGALGLLDALGYRSDRTLLMGDSPEEFLQYFNSGSPPTPTPKELQMLSKKWQSAAMLAQITDTEIRGKNSFVFNKGEIKSFVFIAVDLKKGSHARGDLTRMTRMINKMFAMPAIMIFRDEGKATIAVIHRRENKRDATRDVLEKVTLIKDVSLSNPHTAHIHILAELSLGELIEKHHCGNFDSLYAAWRKTLDISELKNRFYKEVANWFFWAVDSIVFPAGVVGEEARAMWVIRLITRLMFCWFVMEKHLINARLFDEDSLREILSDKLAPESDSFYKAILQNLFFATLNQEMDSSLRKFRNRSAADSGRDSNYMSHNFYRYKDLFADPAAALQYFADAPFLNGGLFECLDRSKKESGDAEIRIDGFSDHKKNPLCAPNNLFFGENQNADLRKHLGENARNSTVRGLISIFNSYKFTVEESTPLDEEVALDPELLGKVLENLLAAYNPDTKQTARKATGSFYTPREIVDYMATESLSAYFVQSLGGDSPTRREKIQKLLSFECEGNPFGKDESRNLIKAIDRIKILDPAVGSGAFPMGALNKLTLALSKLDPNNALWKERQINRAESIEDPGARKNAMEDIERRFRDNELGYGRKLFLIENCIYGADIQPIAVQIAKLRFFISLLVDQRHDDSRKNRGVTPLPNLEAKFLAADTLMGLRAAGVSVELIHAQTRDKERELEKCRRHYFSARTSRTKDKYRDQDKLLREEIAAILSGGGFPEGEANKIALWNPYDQNAVADWFDSEWMFGVGDGFDIVIGNPPYVKKENMSSEIKARLPLYYKERKQLKEIGWCDDLYVHFIFKGAALARKAGGILTYITNDSFVGLKTKERIRKMFLENDLMQLTACPDSTFAQTIYVAIFILARKKSAAHKYESGKLVGNDYHYESLGEVSYNVARKLPDCRLLYRSPMMSVYERLADLPPFENYFRILDTGIHSGNVRHLIFFEDEKRKGLSRLVQGRQIERWGIDWNSPNAKFKWCNPNYVPRDRPGIGRGGKPSDGNEYWKFCADRKNHHKPERLLLRQSDDDLIAAWHSKAVHRQFYTDNTLFTILSKSLGGESHGLKYAMALLNSRLLNSLYQFLSQEKGKTLAQIKTGLVKALPFVDAENTDEVVALVDKIIAAKHANPAADVSQLEGEIDAIVYRLYGLIAAEIRLVESVHKKD